MAVPSYVPKGASAVLRGSLQCERRRQALNANRGGNYQKARQQLRTDTGSGLLLKNDILFMTQPKSC